MASFPKKPTVKPECNKPAVKKGAKANIKPEFNKPAVKKIAKPSK